MSGSRGVMAAPIDRAYPESETSEGEGTFHGSPAAGSVMSEYHARRHQSEEEGKEGSDVQPPDKRLKRTEESMGIQHAAAGDSSSASPAVPPSTPSIRLRYPPFPTTGKLKDLVKWKKECKIIRAIEESDPRLKLPTRRKQHTDPDTTSAVVSSSHKSAVRNAARYIVNFSSIMHDGLSGSQCTGIIMGQHLINEKLRTLIVTCSKIICRKGTLLDPMPKLSVGLPNKTILDGQFLFFNDHYGIALLAIDAEPMLDDPSIGLNPSYGQEVFVLARDKELFLRARHGEILWLEESDYMHRNYQMFLSCEVPVAGNGGPVVDTNGYIIGC